MHKACPPPVPSMRPADRGSYPIDRPPPADNPNDQAAPRIRPTERGDTAGKAATRSPEPPIRLVIVTDARHPQVNGVVRSREIVAVAVCRRGDQGTVIHPALFRTMSRPAPERLSEKARPWMGCASATAMSISSDCCAQRNWHEYTRPATGPFCQAALIHSALRFSKPWHRDCLPLLFPSPAQGW